MFSVTFFADGDEDEQTDPPALVLVTQPRHGFDNVPGTQLFASNGMHAIRLFHGVVETFPDACVKFLGYRDSKQPFFEVLLHIF